MDVVNCPKCKKNSENDSKERNSHIQDLCPADRERIAQLVEKLAQCTEKKHKAESELMRIRDEKDNEKIQLKQQLAAAVSHIQKLKFESSKSLDALGKQLNSQEEEFAKLTETINNLLREKVQMRNALIEKESKIRIAEAKLERIKESMEMEKLLLAKENIRKNVENRFLVDNSSQTINYTNSEANIQEETSNDSLNLSAAAKLAQKIKSKDDLDETSRDAIILRSLFFGSSSSINLDDDYRSFNLQFS